MNGLPHIKPYAVDNPNPYAVLALIIKSTLLYKKFIFYGETTPGTNCILVLLFLKTSQLNTYSGIPTGSFGSHLNNILDFDFCDSGSY